ncbi:Nuclear ribonuclease Z [Glycine soja]|nr:Nuclear ribonuclease Z [Glycine soja]
MNSLFTIAVLVGLSLTILGQCNLENRSFCDTDVDVPKKVIVLEVVLFSFFLFSSLVAQGLKLTLNLLHSKEVDKAFQAHINLKALRLDMGGLPMYVSTRGLYCMKPPTIIVPISVKEDAEKLFEIHRKMDQSELKHNLIGLDVGVIDDAAHYFKDAYDSMIDSLFL